MSPVPKSRRGLSSLFEGLPSLDWPGGRERPQEGVYARPRWQAALLACLFKSQVIWEEGGEFVCTAPEELLQEEPREGVPALPSVTNSESSAV